MVSAFSGKGKIKPLIHVKNYIRTFASIGEEVEISTSRFDASVEFVCEPYGFEENSTDYVFYKIYKLTHGRLEAKGTHTTLFY